MERRCDYAALIGCASNSHVTRLGMPLVKMLAKVWPYCFELYVSLSSYDCWTIMWSLEMKSTVGALLNQSTASGIQHPQIQGVICDYFTNEELLNRVTDTLSLTVISALRLRQRRSLNCPGPTCLGGGCGVVRLFYYQLCPSHYIENKLQFR